MKKIAILTSGGDAPGMNCAIRSVVRYSCHRDLKVIGISRGYQGLIEKEFRELSPRDVSNIISTGGTFLKTARSKDFFNKKKRDRAHRNLLQENIEGMVVIGGNGSFRAADIFYREFNYPVIGIPGTIGNDGSGTQFTLGFDTALNTAMDAVDKIKDTAISMDRIFLIEVMGRHSGAIAVYSALSGGAEDVILPGEGRDMEQIVKKIEQGCKRGKKSWIIILAEGAGWTQDLANKLKEYVDEVRAVVIGHIQRGGKPSAFDRFLGAVMGKAAVDGLLDNKHYHIVGWKNDKPIIYSLSEALKEKKEDHSGLLELIQILT